MTTTHETIAAFLAAAAPFVPCKACGRTGHAITQCNEIARFDLVTHLRAELANAHTAMRCARDLMDDEQYDAAAVVLDNAMEVRR